MLDAKPEPMPERLQAVVKSELESIGREIPTLSIKVVPTPTSVGFLGGYTLHQKQGEICVVYGDMNPQEWEGTVNELNTLLHEMAHWIVGPEYDDGHTPKFYVELTRLALKYGLDMEHVIEDEYNYTGDKIFQGLSLYHYMYNEGRSPFMAKILSFIRG